ncbi:4020_t:CDS:2 [Paraglomus occultum]|uniref:4020_t:CDS:1 n=1 Tax=Paraglomus occultum TaxID=144539 RepID=A0A9N9FZQ2_9GLOM|nr:4020_t:CDS:2 [Paraglomus occultum]
MVLTEYLWHLALRLPMTESKPGSTGLGITEDDETIKSDDPLVRQRDESLYLAQREILLTIARFDVPNEQKEWIELTCGCCLAIGSLASLYFFTYPFFVARTRHQVYPDVFKNHYASPLDYLKYLRTLGQAHGYAKIWSGFKLQVIYHSLVLAHDTIAENIESLMGMAIGNSWFQKCRNYFFDPRDFISYTILFPLLHLSTLQRTNLSFTIPTMSAFLRAYCTTMRCLFTCPENAFYFNNTLLPAYSYHAFFKIIQSHTRTKIYKKIKKEQKRKDEESLFYEFFPNFASSLAGHLLGTALLYPLETVVHRLLAQGNGGMAGAPGVVKYAGIWDCIKRVYRENGILGFYRSMLGGFFGEALIGWLALETTYYVFNRMHKWIKDAYPHPSPPPRLGEYEERN